MRGFGLRRVRRGPSGRWKRRKGSRCVRSGPLLPDPPAERGRGRIRARYDGHHCARGGPSPGPSPRKLRAERGELRVRCGAESVARRASAARPLRSLRLAPPPKPLGEVELQSKSFGWDRTARNEAGRSAPYSRLAPPLPRSWGRGRRLLRGTSKKAVGREGPRRAATAWASNASPGGACRTSRPAIDPSPHMLAAYPRSSPQHRAHGRRLRLHQAQGERDELVLAGGHAVEHHVLQDAGAGAQQHVVHGQSAESNGSGDGASVPNRRSPASTSIRAASASSAAKLRGEHRGVRPRARAHQQPLRRAGGEHLGGPGGVQRGAAGRIHHARGSQVRVQRRRADHRAVREHVERAVGVRCRCAGSSAARTGCTSRRAPAAPSTRCGTASPPARRGARRRAGG